MNVCGYCGTTWKGWHSCWGLRAALPKTQPTDQTLDLRGELSTLQAELTEARNENDRLRTQINREAKAREEQYGKLNTRFIEVSETLAAAQQERNEWHRLAAEYDKVIGAMGAEHLRNRGTLIRHRDDAEADAKALRAELAKVTEERDQWHRLAVESDRQNSLLAAKIKVAALDPDHRAYLEYEFQRAEDEARAIMRTHDGIRADKAIRPRGQV